MRLRLKSSLKRLLKLTASKSKIIYKDLPEDDPKRRCPDVDLATKLLHWKPEVDVEKGLSETIKYFKEKL